MVDTEIGSQLRAARVAAGRTVAAVAADAGLSVPYIANLENGRGNPTLTALSRLASALDMRLVAALIPADTATTAAPARSDVPLSLVRLGRTSRFRNATAVMAEVLGLEKREFIADLIGALAATAGALRREPSEADWWRLLDALLLIATSPASGS